jgi:hypothetical protein
MKLVREQVEQARLQHKLNTAMGELQALRLGRAHIHQDQCQVTRC